VPPTDFEAANPDFEAAVRASFARQALMATLDAALTAVRPGEVEVSMPCAPHVAQQNGFVHAGAVASIADAANGYAAWSLAPAGTDVLAVEFKINLMAPARGERIVAHGRVLRPGRTLTVCLAEVIAHDGARRTPVATMLSTLVVRPVAR
jgi:uncharacterized protein (TIGR00369 family)